MNKFEFLDRFNKDVKLQNGKRALDELVLQLGGNVVNTSTGVFLEVLTEYPQRFIHGTIALQTVMESRSIELDQFETKAGHGNADLRDLVFIDAETTGLSAASGTVAFLVGVGYFAADKFRVHQFFLPDYPEESAMLEAIAQLAIGRSCVVSFNGKCFDLPLLETRYIMQKASTPFGQMHHVDLLHVARRFWKGRFVDSTLQTLEKELLQVYRYNDTPGYLIPQLYFDFLKSGDAEPLMGVLLHNRLDIVTLLFLMNAIQRYLTDAPKHDYYSSTDALRISKHHSRQGNIREASAIAAAQFSGSVKNENDMKLAQQLFKTQKKLGDHLEALSTLQNLQRTTGETRLLALDEAAKICEHKLRDFVQAKRYVQEAIMYLDSPVLEIPYDRVLFWNETFAKRQRRLIKRLN